MAPHGNREQLIGNCQWLFNKNVQVITFVTSSISSQELHYVAAVLEKDCNLESVIQNDFGFVVDPGRISEIERKLQIKVFSLISTDDAISSLLEVVEEEIGFFLQEKSDNDGLELRLSGSQLPLGYPGSLRERAEKRTTKKTHTSSVGPDLVKEVVVLREEITAQQKSDSANLLQLSNRVHLLLDEQQKTGNDEVAPEPKPELDDFALRKSILILDPFRTRFSTSTTSTTDTKSSTLVLSPSLTSATTASIAGSENTSPEPSLIQTWNKLKFIHEQHEWLFNQHLLDDKRMERYVRQDLAELAGSILAYLGEGEQKSQ